MATKTKENNNPKILRAFAFVSVFISITSLIWVVYNFTEIIHFKEWLLKPEKEAVIVFYGLLYLFANHFFLFVTMILAIRSFKNIRIVGTISLILEILSIVVDQKSVSL